MALINCPECGGQVSSTAKQCTHCGCKITVCPECGKAWAGEISVCSECGFEFNNNGAEKSIKQEGGNNTGSEFSRDAIATWQKTSLADASVLKLIKFIKIAVQVVALALAATAAILLTTWKKSPPIEQLEGLKSLKTSLNCIIAFACIFEIFDLLVDPFKNSFIKLRCGNWIRSRTDFDAVAYIRECGSLMGTGKDEENFGLFTEATYLSETQKSKSAVYIGLAVRCICAIALGICIGFCVMQNLDEYIRITVIEGTKFHFKYIALIAAAVVAVIYFSSVLLTDSLYGKGYQAWLKQTFPYLLNGQNK